MRINRYLAVASLIAVTWYGGRAHAQAAGNKLELAGGKVELTAPDSWQRQKPRTSIVEFEFSVPASEGDPRDGRMTIMAAGGGVEANVARWVGQFTQPDGGSTAERMKIEKREVDGQDVHFVDIAGTYKDQAGPFTPATERPDYRMLAAIIPVKGGGVYYLKFYGPKRTVTDNEKAFRSMVEGLERK